MSRESWCLPARAIAAFTPPRIWPNWPSCAILRRRGFSLQRIRKMIDLLRREFGHRLAELLSRGPGLHLLTDGESIFLCDSERGVIDLLRDTQQPLLAICVGPILERVLAQAPAAGACAAAELLRPRPEQRFTLRTRHRRRPRTQRFAAPKKGSQPVRAARAARAKARP